MWSASRIRLPLGYLSQLQLRSVEISHVVLFIDLLQRIQVDLTASIIACRDWAPRPALLNLLQPPFGLVTTWGLNSLLLTTFQRQFWVATLIPVWVDVGHRLSIILILRWFVALWLFTNNRCQRLVSIKIVNFVEIGCWFTPLFMHQGNLRRF